MAIDDERHTGRREDAAAPDDAAAELVELRSHLQAGLKLVEALGSAARSAQARADAQRRPPGGASQAAAALRAEHSALEAKNRELELVLRQVEMRALSAEQDLSDIANAYIASSQLHVGLTPQRVITHIGELLSQLVGAECFVVYLLDAGARTARAVSFEGIAASELVPVQVGVGMVGEAMQSGELAMRGDIPLGRGSLREPLAVVPLLVSGQAIGAVSVVRLLAQKPTWAAVDHELFQLLSQHAGVALLTAHLFRQQPDLLTALAGLGDSLT
jgi:GAF domain